VRLSTSAGSPGACTAKETIKSFPDSVVMNVTKSIGTANV